MKNINGFKIELRGFGTWEDFVASLGDTSYEEFRRKRKLERQGLCEWDEFECDELATRSFCGLDLCSKHYVILKDRYFIKC